MKSTLPDSFKTRQFDSLVEPSTPTSEIILQLAVFAVFLRNYFFLKLSVQRTSPKEREREGQPVACMHSILRNSTQGTPPPSSKVPDLDESVIFWILFSGQICFILSRFDPCFAQVHLTSINASHLLNVAVVAFYMPPLLTVRPPPQPLRSKGSIPAPSNGAVCPPARHCII